MNKSQADIEFARIAQERQWQISWIHLVFSNCGVSSSSKRVTMDLLHDENNINKHDIGGINTINHNSSSCWLLRELNSSEIKVLQNNGCQCSNWSLLRLLICLPPNNECQNDNMKINQEEEEQQQQHATNSTLQLLRRFVTNTTFAGRVVFMLEHEHLHDSHNNNNDAAWTNVLPRGIHHNGVISDSILAVNTSWIWHNTIISNSYIASQAVVLRCGVIRTGNTTTISPHTQISSCSCNILDAPLALTVGPESGGGRHLLLSAQATMKEVHDQLQYFDNDVNHGVVTRKQQLQSHNDAVTLNISDWNVIGKKTILRDTATVESIYMHAMAIIEGAASVKRTILFPQASIGAASAVSNVRLQWKACIGSQSCISDTLLMECAEAGPQSIVAHAVLGPDSHVSAGEVHGSVLGPNTNAHHQSLVIGLLWPFGRGNVGYGANVGSNHTGRLPDQESCAGEGTFWGLSSVVVFPVNLMDAPYSIIAAGTTLKSQRLPPMPFSLLLNDNTLLPAWVLSSSLYTLVRAEMKFKNRRKAIHHAYYTGWKVMRPDIIALCQAARVILQDSRSLPSSSSASSLYTWSDKTRQKGIQAYTDCIQRYLLHGLLSFLMQELTLHGVAMVGGPTDAPLVQSTNSQEITVEALLAQTFSATSDKEQCPSIAISSSNTANVETTRSPTTQWPPSPWDKTDDSRSSSGEWAYKRKLLLEEFPPSSQPSMWTFWVGNTLLPRLIHLENEYAERVFQSKLRDDSRGKMIIPGYEQSHVATAQDPVIVHVRKMAKETTDKVTMILQKIQHEKKSRL